MTLHALPTTERRELDRDQPARALTVEQHGTRTFWVLIGADEILADSAAHQRLMISTHNANRLRPTSADDPYFEHYRSQS